MYQEEKKRHVNSVGVVSFLKRFFREKGGEGEEGMRKYFAKWSPYRIRKVHVKLIGKNEIYRPGSKLVSIDGTRDMYHFVGRNVPKHDAATTMEGLKEDHKLVLKRDGGRRLSREEKRRLAELDKEKIAVMEDKGRWADVEPEEPILGEEEVTVRKIKRRYPVRTRLASCFCSSCQISNYEEYHVTRTYLALVPVFQDGEVTETVLMDTGVAPEGVDEPPAIKFGARKKECKIPRLLGPSGKRATRMKFVTCGRTLGGRKSAHFLPMKGSSMPDFRCAMLLQTCTGG